MKTSIAITLLAANGVFAALPLVDFDRMGKVGLAGAFAGLDLYQSSVPKFDAATSSLLSRSSKGALSRLGSTNAGGRISSGCAMNDIFYFAGSFSTIESVTAPNIAAYSSGTFSALGSGGPNGEIEAVHCDEKNQQVWVGGSFSSPGASVAVWSVRDKSWARPPFVGVAGGAAKVFSITANPSGTSLFFAGSFLASFRGPGGISGSSNPNVPPSKGATPFSQSLVPIPLSRIRDIVGSPSSEDRNFGNVRSILCPSGDDGPGNSWRAADGITARITVRRFSFISVNGIRLGNTFLDNYSTTGFK